MEKVYLWITKAPFISANGSKMYSMVSVKSSLKIKATMKATMSKVRSMGMEKLLGPMDLHMKANSSKMKFVDMVTTFGQIKTSMLATLEIAR